MPEHKNDSQRAYASAPVNQRTAPRAAINPPPVHASLKARAQRARQRQLLGTPMSGLVARRQAGAPHERDKFHPGVIAATVCAVAAASALILIRSSAGLALAAALTALGGASFLWQHRSQRLTTPAPASLPPFDIEALRKVDEAFEATAAVASEPVLAALISLKAAAVRVTLALHSSEVDVGFTVDDRMYVIESMRRYIPDTLAAYLRVPPTQRALPGLQPAKGADQLLLDQLALLQSQLEMREQRLQGSALETLLQQQRFLESKAARG